MEAKNKLTSNDKIANLIYEKSISKNLLRNYLHHCVVFIFELILAYLPTKSKTNRPGISPEEAANLRQNLKETHHVFITTDGETLFLRRWNA